MLERMVKRLDRLTATESRQVADDRRWPLALRELASARAQMLESFDGADVDSDLRLAYALRRAELLGGGAIVAPTPCVIERWMEGRLHLGEAA